MRFLFSPYGRTNRLGYWTFIAIYIAATIASVGADRALGVQDAEQAPGLIEMLVSLFFLWPSIAVSVRRLHDFGYSGWWLLWVALISAGILIISMIGVGFTGLAAEFFESPIAIDESTPFTNYPAVFWVIFGAAAAPYLIQTFMLLFLPGEKEENQYDREASVEARDKAAPPPWAD